ncbi:serine/threonine protein kinase [Teratosphaeria nubilosa]|uniref:Serine/threonine protein kinase n=1 Tax=Teratosphaeria nubilosa TaxID=161662 RepID=A0A6G1L031_9PEZI|nr:serine/threonine protein kinase [Teratosphaeria nubilosa]
MDRRKILFEHEGTEHLAINNTFLRRVLTRLAYKTLRRCHQSDGHCFPISKTLVIKHGVRVHLAEAATMEFLRALKPPPGTGVESCIGGSLFDSRIAHLRDRSGPFTTIQDFHFWLRQGFSKSAMAGHDDPDGELREIEEMIELQDGPWPPPIFTHADLNPFNILLRGEKVVGIIDWGFSGWYSHYWEYTSAWHGNITRTDWQGDLDRLLEPQPKELIMEHTRQRWWGEI